MSWNLYSAVIFHLWSDWTDHQWARDCLDWEEMGGHLSGDVAGAPAQTSEGQAILSVQCELVGVLPETQRWWERSGRRCVYLERFVLRNCSHDCEVNIQSHSGDPGKSYSSTPKAVCWQNFFWLKLSLSSLKSSTSFESHPHYGRHSAVLKIYSFKC